MSLADRISPAPHAPPKHRREWSPQLWMGMNFSGWLRLLAKNRFDVGWQYWPYAAALTGWSLLNSSWSAVQALTHGWRARQHEIKQPPIFILGHWRSGTTLLHELMALDPRHGYPTTYETTAPNHFLLTESVLGRNLEFLVPRQRPMDNMPYGMCRPQEDELAICNLGLPTPFLSMAFPNRPMQDPEYITLDGVPRADRERWKRTLMEFFRQVSYRQQKRLVIKSPLHTARIKVLLEMFPEARFVHIVRNPFVVFSSTMHLWRKLYPLHGLQKPTYAGLEEQVLDTFNRIYRAYDRDRELIAPDRLVELRYEDLVDDPVPQLRQIYETLDLGDIDEVQPRWEAYWADQQGYQTNHYHLSAEARERVAQSWGWFIEQHGYEVPVA